MVDKGTIATLSDDELDALVHNGLSDRVDELIAESQSERTKELYGRAYAWFVNFCQDYGGRDRETGVRNKGLTPLPASPDTIALFVGACADAERNPTTIGIALAAIAHKHRVAGEPVPDRTKASKALAGYKTRRQRQGVRVKRSAPARTYDLEQLLEPVDLTEPQGLRDRAMITLGYAVAARRRVLCNLDLTDFREIRPGVYQVRIVRDKGGTDRMCLIEHWGVPKRGRCADVLCPVCAVLAWIGHLRELGVERGPMFRTVDRHGNIGGLKPVAGHKVSDGRLSLRAVNKIVDRLRRTAGLPPGITPHSLRAGFATENYELGADALWIKRHGGWEDSSTAFNIYVRDVDMVANNPLNQLREKRRSTRKR